GRPDDLLSSLGLDGPGIAASVLEAARRHGLAGAGPRDGLGEDGELEAGGSQIALPSAAALAVASHVWRRR
ncbi:MAG TPA: hypothetical protein VKU92_03045, partial [Acidimicrobiales bacterium]|nr:hypothetical protein [Acidimicrobiales bacterium]